VVEKTSSAKDEDKTQWSSREDSLLDFT
jgi:hypothetical protein